jgi:hypothetical protein
MPKEVSTGSSSLLEDIDAFTDLPDASPEECQRALAEFQKERAEYFQQEETAIRVKKIAAGKKILQAFQITRKATLETGGTNTHCAPATTAPAPIYSEVTDLKIRDTEFPCSPPPSLLPTAILGSTCKHIFNNTISNRDVVPVSSPPPTAGFGSAGADRPDNPDRGLYPSGSFVPVSSPPPTASFGSAGADCPDNPDLRLYPSGTFVSVLPPPPTASFGSAGAFDFDNPDNPRKPAQELWAYFASRG